MAVHMLSYAVLDLHVHIFRQGVGGKEKGRMEVAHGSCSDLLNWPKGVVNAIGIKFSIRVSIQGLMTCAFQTGSQVPEIHSVCSVLPATVTYSFVHQ